MPSPALTLELAAALAWALDQLDDDEADSLDPDYRAALDGARALLARVEES
jgi:hypothetical protein